MKANLGISLDNDPFLEELRIYAIKNKRTIYLGGKSALTRILHIPFPETEVLVFDGAPDIEDFRSSDEDKGGFLVESPPFNDFYIFPFAKKSCMLLTNQAFIENLCVDIEGIMIDVTELQMFDALHDSSKSALKNNTITLTKKSQQHPEYYWKAVEFISHFGGFKCDFSGENLGKIMYDLGVQFSSRPLYGEWLPPYPIRIVTGALVNISTLPHFPFNVMRDYLDNLCGCIHEASKYNKAAINAYENFIVNSENGLCTLHPAVKLAFLFLPLAVLEFYDRRCVDEIFKRVAKPQDFDDMMKLHVVESNKSNFLFWFLVSHYCFPTPLAFDILSILTAWRILMNTKTYSSWAYIYGGKYWKEIVAMKPPEQFNAIMKDIHNDAGAMNVLNSMDTREYSNNEIAKAHGYQSMYRINIEELKEKFFNYLKKNPDGTLEDYANYVNQNKAAH